LIPASEDLGPTIVATLTGGPLAGTTMEVPAVEGRPPKTLDADGDGGRVRYGLDEWEQSGHSAVYSFLYVV
jgi:hypothetical protein